MKKLFLYCLVLSLSACRCNETDDNGAVVNLNFKAQFAGQPLILEDYDNSLPYPLGYNFRLTRLRFFISDVTLLRGNEEFPILDVADVDFSRHQRQVATAADGENVNINQAPIGTYDGIRFGIGLNATQNNSSPSDFPSSSPLQDHYWESWSSYIFSEVEGQADINQDNTFSRSFLMHIGRNEFYRTKTFMTPITVSAASTTTIVFPLDAERLFYNATDTVDLRTDYRTQSPEPNTPAQQQEYNLSVRIVDNLPSAIQVQ